MRPPVVLFLCGDVMTGRGIDQVLPDPVHPRLHEPVVRSATRYVELAEEANGPIPRPMDPAAVWGEALGVLHRVAPAVRIINLETAVTRSEAYWKGKGVHYRMSPSHVSLLHAAGVDCGVLANNHVLDWGYEGLEETLATLEAAGVSITGAGRSLEEAAAPAAIGPTDRRVLVFGLGSPSSGIPRSWAAGPQRPGVHLVPESVETARRLAERVRGSAGDVVVVASVHWGANWGYDVPHEQVELAHALIDEAGVDVVHGHSSHHVKGMEIYRGKLVLYGCGDFLNDYEGIPGHDGYRPDLTLMYFPTLDGATGTLRSLTLAPMRIERFSLHHASEPDTRWLRDRLDRESGRFGVRFRLSADGWLHAAWDGAG